LRVQQPLDFFNDGLATREKGLEELDVRLKRHIGNATLCGRPFLRSEEGMNDYGSRQFADHHAS
jgi:hypothetical protein